MKRKERLGEVIAQRQLTVAGSNKKVTIRLGKPFQITEREDSVIIFGCIAPVFKGDWVCPFKITGLPEIKELPAPGYNEIGGKDSMDALLGALMVMNSILDKCHPDLHWRYSYGLNPGFPIIMEYYALTNKLELQDKFAKELLKSRKKSNYQYSPYWQSMLKKIAKGEK